MLILFSNHISYDKLINFIFDFYDIDKDGYVTKEDIKIILSYIKLISKGQKVVKGDIIGKYK